MRILIVYSVFLLFVARVIAQNQEPVYDSLVIALANAKDDTTKIIIIKEIAEQIAWNNPKQAQQYTKNGIKIAQNLTNKKWLAVMFFEHGYTFYEMRDYHNAKQFYTKALRLWQQQNSSYDVAEAFNNIGIVHWSLNHLREAKIYYDSALTIFEQIYDTAGSIRTKNNIALVAKANGAFTTALKNYYDVLKYHESKKNVIKIANVSMNIGVLHLELKNYNSAAYYFYKALFHYTELQRQKDIIDARLNLGLLSSRQNKFEEALFHYRAAQRILSFYPDRELEAKLWLDMGCVYYYLENYDMALLHLRKALCLFNTMQHQKGSHNTQLQMIETFMQLGQMDSVFHYVEETEVLLKYMEGLSTNQMAHYYLAAYYEKKQQIPLALEHYKKYVALSDSLYNSAKNRQLLELTTKYETEKKEQEIKILKALQQAQSLTISRNRWLFAFIVGLFMFIAAIAYLWWRYSRQKSSEAYLNLQHRLLRSQLNPHFIFNSLNAVHNSILENKNPEAMHLLNGFTTLMRQILESSKNDLITLQEEQTLVAQYLKLQAVRFAGKFEYSLQTNDNIDAENTLLPPMLGQPFIENAIEHGFKQLQGNGLLQIRWSLCNKGLSYEIEDNGSGFIDADAKAKTKHISRATAITRERLQLLAKRYKQAAYVEILDKKQLNKTQGVLVVIKIPYISE